MKCIIVTKSEDISWPDKYFSASSPYMLKILNKPLIEYYIDFCSISGVDEIRIASDSSSSSLIEYVEDGTKWGMKISFILSRPSDALSDIIQKNMAFRGESDLLIINGSIFINYDKNNGHYPFLKEVENVSITDKKGNGLYYLPCADGRERDIKFREYDDSLLSVRSLGSVSDYFEISIDLLRKSSDKYVIPGYGNQPNTYIGQNVEITKMAQVLPPVCIGDNVKIINASIGPCIIVGSNVLVDGKTKIDNSIVYENTYVGSDLEISGKILAGKKVIDPKSGEALDITDDFIISDINDKQAGRLCEKSLLWIVALTLWLIQTPFYFVFRPFSGAVSELKNVCLSKNPAVTGDLLFLTKKSTSFMRSLFFKLSLHKYPLLTKVLAGKLHLAGNAPVVSGSKEQCGLLNDMPVYKPAAFTFNEMLGKESAEGFEKDINELYYSNNTSLLLDIKILTRTIILNLFK